MACKGYGIYGSYMMMSMRRFCGIWCNLTRYLYGVGCLYWTLQTDISHDANFSVTTTAYYATNDVSILFLIYLIITVTSQCVPWRLRSPGSQLFAQPFVQAHIKENVKALRYWPLLEESTGDRPVDPPHKGPVTQNCFHLMTSSW